MDSSKNQQVKKTKKIEKLFKKEIERP